MLADANVRTTLSRQCLGHSTHTVSCEETMDDVKQTGRYGEREKWPCVSRWRRKKKHEKENEKWN